jgi:hypothetical protein
MPGRILLVIVLGLACFVPGHRVVAAELEEQTTRAYVEYVAQARLKFLNRVHDRPESTSGAKLGQDGQITARPGAQDGIVSVPGGLVHHWRGATFLPGVTMKEALGVSHDYADYAEIYTPIVGSRFLGRDGDKYRALLRLKESAGGISAVLDVTLDIQYFYPDSATAYSLSSSEQVLEVKDAGTSRERHLPAGRDSGYLWRLATMNRFIQRDDGLVVEMETMGLSRRFPSMLSWIIEPIARRLGRKSIELSVQEFTRAVRARQGQPGQGVAAGYEQRPHQP